MEAQQVAVPGVPAAERRVRGAGGGSSAGRDGCRHHGGAGQRSAIGPRSGRSIGSWRPATIRRLGRRALGRWPMAFSRTSTTPSSRTTTVRSPPDARIAVANRTAYLDWVDRIADWVAGGSTMDQIPTPATFQTAVFAVERIGLPTAPGSSCATRPRPPPWRLGLGRRNGPAIAGPFLTVCDPDSAVARWRLVATADGSVHERELVHLRAERAVARRDVGLVGPTRRRWPWCPPTSSRRPSASGS